MIYLYLLWFINQQTILGRAQPCRQKKVKQQNSHGLGGEHAVNTSPPHLWVMFQGEVPHTITLVL